MKLSKSSRFSFIGLAVATLLGTAIITPSASAATSTLGTVYFASNSATLTPAAKRTLQSLKNSISKSDSVTATGHIRNHSNKSASIAQDRANAVKNYLASIGVKAKIKVANGGMPKVGSSLASADNVVVSKVAVVQSSTYYIGAGMLSTLLESNLSESFCTGISLKAELTPTNGGASSSSSVKGTWTVSKACTFNAEITGKFTGTYTAKLTLTDPSNAKILKLYHPGGGTRSLFTFSHPDDDTLVIVRKDKVTPVPGGFENQFSTPVWDD